ncbi:MAG: hypothetical protein V4696_03645 [Pseudomonadota bacterium]
MSIYADMTVEQLEAEIQSLREKIRGGTEPSIRSVAGEGRRVEFAGGNASNLRQLLREAEAALAVLTGGSGGQAIGVWFP